MYNDEVVALEESLNASVSERDAAAIELEALRDEVAALRQLKEEVCGAGMSYLGRRAFARATQLFV